MVRSIILVAVMLLLSACNGVFSESDVRNSYRTRTSPPAESQTAAENIIDHAQSNPNGSGENWNDVNWDEAKETVPPLNMDEIVKDLAPVFNPENPTEAAMPLPNPPTIPSTSPSPNPPQTAISNRCELNASDLALGLDVVSRELVKCLRSIPAGGLDLLIIGDSISVNFNPAENTGYGKILNQRSPQKVIANLAIPGSSAGLWVSQPQFQTLLVTALSRKPKAIILFLGGNDIITAEPAADGIVDQQGLSRYITAQSILISSIQTISPESRLMMPTYYDVFDKQSYRIPISTVAEAASAGLLAKGVWRYTSYNTYVLNLAIVALAKASGATLVDMYPSFLGHSYGAGFWSCHFPRSAFFVMRNDGRNGACLPRGFDVHQSTPGHQKMADLFERSLGYPEMKDAVASAPNP